ncbi:4307_t:CDS:2 [Rhizophagus irregularis]|nr:4307_t:CDS:2 [Rhizophagus irregularis]
MSYFPRADDFAPAPGYDHTPDNKIPDVSFCKTFKDFHATRLFNRWAKKKKHQNFSNRLGISFTTSYHVYNTNVVATKGLDFIYGKKYGNLQFTPSTSPNVKKRQEAPARRHKLLFQENQSFTTPIKHLRYKNKFAEPSQSYYTFPIPFPEPKTVSVPVIVETICNISSVTPKPNDIPISPANTDNWENVPEHYIPLIPQSAIYEGGRLNQPSHNKVQKKKLQPLAVGSDGWLAHMKEIYDDHVSMIEYEQGRIDAGIQWGTTPDQGEYRMDLCNHVMEFTNAQYNYEMKLLEISSEVIPDLPTVSGPLKQSERKKHEKRRLQLLREIERKKQEDTEILEELYSRVHNLENIFCIEYYTKEIGLAFQSCAIIDDRPLKRSASDNSNLDTHYGYHKDKKVCILSASKDLENSSSTRTI